jgi:hypothetical protein
MARASAVKMPGTADWKLAAKPSPEGWSWRGAPLTVSERVRMGEASAMVTARATGTPTVVSGGVAVSVTTGRRASPVNSTTENRALAEAAAPSGSVAVKVMVSAAVVPAA